MSAPYWEPLGAVPGGALPPPTTPGDDGKWLRAQGGAAVWAGAKAARVASTVTVTIPNGVVTAIPFNTVIFDTDTMWSAGAPTLLTCRTAGVYVISGLAFWGTAGVGERVLTIEVDGFAVADLSSYVAAGFSPRQNVTTVVNLAVNAAVRVTAYHGVGTPADIAAYANRSPVLAMTRIG